MIPNEQILETFATGAYYKKNYKGGVLNTSEFESSFQETHYGVLRKKKSFDFRLLYLRSW